jgi:hypothetical protein
MMYRVSDGQPVEAAKPTGLGGIEILLGLLWALGIGLLYQSFALGVQCYMAFIAADAIGRYLLFKFHN